MRTIIVALTAILATPATAAGYNAKDAAACYIYASANNMPDIAGMAVKLTAAYKAEAEMKVQAEAFAAKVKRDFDSNPILGAAEMNRAGRSGCMVIGVM
jgi:hypothetical protein